MKEKTVLITIENMCYADNIIPYFNYEEHNVNNFYNITIFYFYYVSKLYKFS